MSMTEARITKLRREVKQLFLYGVDAVNPYNAVKKALRVQKNKILIGLGKSDMLSCDLRRFERIIVVGMGKATALMAKAVDEILGSRIKDGCVVVKYGYTAELEAIRTIEAGHPLPDENGLKGAQEIAQLVEAAQENDLIIFLISGGGSALLPLPADSVAFEEKQRMTRQLLECGADIQEINAIRKHISKVKGGQLARLAYPATIVSLILSDVVGDRLDTIASGPTVPDNTTFKEAQGIINKYNLADRIPDSIRARIESGVRGDIDDTPKYGDRIFKKTHNLIVGSNLIALKAIEKKARAMNYHTLILSSSIEGEAREAAKVLAAITKEITNSGHPLRSPACIISGGETTVTIRGKGKGGRNQELGLAAAMALASVDNFVFLSAGTDGTDGPTDAAGAIVDGQTIKSALEAGINPNEALKNNDSYHLLKRTDELLVTGPTNTNVMDIQIILLDK
jgi:glycerate 2-kinase